MAATAAQPLLGAATSDPHGGAAAARPRPRPWPLARSHTVAFLELRVAVSAMVLLVTMAGYSLAYVYVVDDDRDGTLNDQAGGWAQDMLLALTASLFAVSGRIAGHGDPYVLFYLGTVMAYGLGGMAHFLEKFSGSATGLTAYYLVMTLAFGGDAVRAAVGYGLPRTLLPVRVQRGFAAAIYACLCATACLTLHALLGGAPAVEVQESTLGVAYKSSQVGMGFVEISGSLVWLRLTGRETQGLGGLAAASNVAAWLLVKFQPLLYQVWGFKTSVAHRLAHYAQMVVVWSLHTLSLRKELAAARKSAASSAPGA